MIDLHFVPSPNGMKVSIMLEEIGLPYRKIDYDLFRGDQLAPEYRKINPNNRLPAITDHAPADGGAPVNVFESGACLVYLAEKTGKLLATEFRRRTQTLQWVMWQMAGLGPMSGQAHHFVRYAPEGNEYGSTRYVRETNRLFDVMEYRLGQEAYLAGDYSIADIACWPWVRTNALIDIVIGERKNLARWYKDIERRPAVERGGKIPGNSMQTTPEFRRPKLTEEQWSALFGERMFAASKG
jgi:GST-like protein